MLKVAMVLQAGGQFLKGMAAPVMKAMHGAKGLFGRGQQAAGVVRSVVTGAKGVDPLFTAGSKTVANANAARAPYGFMDGIKAVNPTTGAANSWASRVGRGVGGVGIGATIVGAPYAGASYLGAASADPESVQSNAMAMAKQRLDARTNEFSNLGMMDRFRLAYNPSMYSDAIRNNSPELMQLAQNANAKKPGLMSYAVGLNPFASIFGGVDPIGQATHHAFMSGVGGSTLPEVGYKEVQKQRPEGLYGPTTTPYLKSSAYMNKSAAGWLQAARSGFSAAKPALAGAAQGIGSKVVGGISNLLGKYAPKSLTNTAGNLAAKSKGNAFEAGNKAFNGMGSLTHPQQLLTNSIHGMASNPLKTLGGAAMVASTPYFLGSSYDAGRAQVYDTAAQDAMGMADNQFANTFETPGLGGSLARYGAALMPGQMQNIIDREWARIQQARTPFKPGQVASAQ